jgi:hypothetical protein
MPRSGGHAATRSTMAMLTARQAELGLPAEPRRPDLPSGHPRMPQSARMPMSGRESVSATTPRALPGSYPGAGFVQEGFRSL